MIDFLMAAAADGAPSGFGPGERTGFDADRAEVLVRTHWAAVRRFLRFLGADAATADDLAQDVFVVALRKGVENRDSQAAFGFLRATARNLFRAQRRRRLPIPVEHLELVWEEQERGVDRRREALRACMRRLTDKVQRALHLAYAERRSREEVAAALGIRPGGVKSMMRRAHRTLRECVLKSLASERREV